MPTWTKITYKEFYDVPRTFIMRHRSILLLFDCMFDDALDKYPDNYRAYELPQLSSEQLAASWEQIVNAATRYVGKIPVKQIRFDASLRAEVDAEAIEAWGKKMRWWD